MISSDSWLPRTLAAPTITPPLSCVPAARPATGCGLSSRRSPAWDTPGVTDYAITSLEEARAYLAHPVLGPRLIECATILAAPARPHRGADLRRSRRAEAALVHHAVHARRSRRAGVPSGPGPVFRRRTGLRDRAAHLIELANVCSAAADRATAMVSAETLASCRPLVRLCHARCDRFSSGQRARAEPGRPADGPLSSQGPRLCGMVEEGRSVVQLFPAWTRAGRSSDTRRGRPLMCLLRLG